MRMVLQHSPNELIGNTIGSITQIECCGTLIKRTLTGEFLIRNLIIKSNHLRKEVILIEGIEKTA